MDELLVVGDLFKGNVITLVRKNQEDTLKYYKKALEEKKVLNIMFGSSHASGDMFLEDHNVTVMLSNAELKRYNPNYKPFINREYECTVKEVDFDKALVTLAAVVHENVALSKFEMERQRIIDAIDSAIESGKKVSVRARVAYISKENNRVYVDIAGARIRGYIPISEWRDSFVPDLNTAVTLGSIIDVSVSKTKDMLGYRCSRKQAMSKDIWEGIEEKFPLRSVVRVTCSFLSKHEWFGCIPGVEEIEVYCPYPDPEDNILIEKGKEYLCNVYCVSEATRQLKCRPFKTID